MLVDGRPRGVYTWAAALTNAGLPASETFLCPTYEPGFFTNWFLTYGVRSNPPGEFAKTNRLDFSVVLLWAQVTQPSEYLHVADTTSRGRQGYAARQFYVFDVAQSKQVHARHNRQANGLFADGHVEGCGTMRLGELGIDALYDADTAPGYF